jgi:hypothetical protein
MKFISILLREGRKEDLKKKYSEKFDEEVLDWILNISDLVDFNHKYTDFVLRVLENENMDVAWWVETIIEELKLFDKYQNQLEKKDINQYKTFTELQNAVTPLQQKEKEKELEGQVKKIYEDDTFVVVVPETRAASCKYGSNTKWCTASKQDNRFDTYTTGKQKLYYIINKKKSSGSNYSKVAIHFNNSGNKTYWDSADYNMNPREVDVLNYAFPEMMDAIDDDYQQVSENESIVKDAFNNQKRTTTSIHDYLNSGKDLLVTIFGFQPISDMPGHYEGEVKIELDGDNKFMIDNYNLLVRIQYNKSKPNIYHADVEFVGINEGGEYFRDLDLENWEISDVFVIQDTPYTTLSLFQQRLANEIKEHIDRNPKLMELVLGDQRVWNPNRHDYGYTFARSDKGMIKKLTDWLDSDKVGTKLDFLTEIGKLDKKIENGKTYYSFKGKNFFQPSSNWRGEFSSFFASAKIAGILAYQKQGNKFLLVKGPNYEAFKTGKLKAL